jgi:integrase
MSVRKRGDTWQYVFDTPGSKKRDRKQVKAGGFATKREAEAAEAKRRLEEQAKYEASRNPTTPNTLRSLLTAFVAEHAEKKLAPKTVERYRELAAYVHHELLAMHIAEITPLHLEREWSRLLASGGHHRRTKAPRPLSAKTVRHIAAVVSSAFGRAIHWGLVTANPVTKSEPPVPKKHKGMALTPEQQQMIFSAATSPWCLGPFLRMEGATGARRGEVLALRWSDIVDGRAIITRSLCQTKSGLEFKSTKSDEPRSVSLSISVLAALERHRIQQDQFRVQFGPDYAAGDLIFANPDGTPLRPDSISSAVSQLCRRLKLPKGVSLHTLRHSHGSHLLAAGVDLPTVSERLGHSSVRVTADVYTHAIRGRDDEAARKWEEFQIAGRSAAERVQ